MALSPPVGYSTSQLIFEDEFDAATLDTSKWNPWMGEDVYGRWGNRGTLPSPYSGENAGGYPVQYNDPYPYGYSVNTTGDHLTGGDGTLELIATPSDYFSDLGYSWASSAISSYDKAYLPAEGGYLQITAKMPDSRYGMWAGLWLMPTAGSDGSEFDLQESGTYGTTGSDTANRMLSSNWWGNGADQQHADTGVDLSADYHTYGVEYRPGESWKVYLDGELMFTWTEGVSQNAAYEVIIELLVAGDDTAGWHTVADPENNPGPFVLSIDAVQIYSLADSPVTIPSAPSALTLDPASDSGTVGDRITNVTRPTITGKGVAGNSIKLFDGTTQVGSATVQSNGAWSVTASTLSSAAHNLTATATDAAGTVSAASATLVVTIDTTAPTVTATLVSDTGSSSSDKITSNPAVTGVAVANSAVTISEGGTVLGTVTASSSGAWSFTPVLSDGTHTLVANATDAAGNAGTASLTFTLDTTATGTIDVVDTDKTPRGNRDNRGNKKIISKPIVTGTADTDATVTIAEGDTPLGTATADNSGVWTYEPVLSDGTHTLVADQTDLAGNTGTASLTFTLETYAVSDPLVTNAAGTLAVGRALSGQITAQEIGGLGPEWEFGGAGYLLGASSAGFLLRNTSDDLAGWLVVGEVDGGEVSYTTIGTIGLDWQLVGNADFVGDGQSEILIWDANAPDTGTLQLGQVVNGTVSFEAVGGVGVEWEFAGNGDFLGNGRDGFLIYNNGDVIDGALTVGEVIDGELIFTELGSLGPEWEFKGVGDFLGHGRDGFLIYNTGDIIGGSLVIGEMIDNTLTFTDIGAVGEEWEFVGTGDYIGDARTDFLMFNTGSGALVAGSVDGAASFTEIGNFGSEWSFHSGNAALLPRPA